MAILDSIDWAAARRHYDDRVRVSSALAQLYNQKSVDKFANLALGITDADGNYSAREHGLGPKILYPGHNWNAERKVFEPAGEFISLTDARGVPELIARADLTYLKIGVGSEISCIVNPKVCWVANTRTIWTHLVIKHADSIRKADEEFKLYRETDASSEMDYQNIALTRIAEIGQGNAKKSKITPGSITYIWADAIASALCVVHHD
jgi:hypothetical protein